MCACSASNDVHRSKMDKINLTWTEVPGRARAGAPRDTQATGVAVEAGCTGSAGGQRHTTCCWSETPYWALHACAGGGVAIPPRWAGRCWGGGVGARCAHVPGSTRPGTCRRGQAHTVSIYACRALGAHTRASDTVPSDGALLRSGGAGGRGSRTRSSCRCARDRC